MLNVTKSVKILILCLLQLFSEKFAVVDLPEEPIGEYGVSIKEIWHDESCQAARIDSISPDGSVILTASYGGSDVKTGVIGSDGDIIVPIAYSAVRPFGQGQYCVGWWGNNGFEKRVVDSAGEELFDLSKYDSVSDFINGFASVYLNGKYGLIGKTGEEILPCEYDGIFWNSYGTIWAQKNGLFRFYGENGIPKSPVEYSDIANNGNFCEYEELMTVEKDGKYGVADKYGEEILPCVYLNALICDNDRIAVLDNGWKYLNEKGELIASVYFDYPGKFSEGLAPVLFNDKYGYVDKQGQLALPFDYSSAGAFEDGIANVCKSENGTSDWYLINTNGERIAEPKDYIIEAKGGILLGKCCADGGTSSFSGPPIYKYAVLDDSGNNLTEFIYADISGFEQGIATAAHCDTGLYGLINKNGEEITPFVFDSVALIGNGSYAVTINGSSLGILTVPNSDGGARDSAMQRY